MIKSAALLTVLAAAAAAQGQVFTNPTPVIIPATGTSGPGGPYPSVISVTGVGTVTDVTVTLHELFHTFPDDIDVLLVGPSGQMLLLMSDAGGSIDATGQTFSFNDGGIAMLDSAFNATGTYATTNFGTGDVFSAPAPAGPYGSGSLLTLFNTGTINGNWSLYIIDDVGGDVGRLAGGWSINIVPSPSAAALFGVGALAASRRRRV